MASVPVPVCSIAPSVLFSVAAPSVRLWPLLAIRPPSLLLSTPLGELKLMALAAVPVWMIWPPWLFKLARFNANNPALKVLRCSGLLVLLLLFKLWVSLALAVRLKVPGVTSTARWVVMLPLVAVALMLAALVCCRSNPR